MKGNVTATIHIRRYAGKAVRAFAGLLILTGIFMAGCSNPFDPPDSGKAGGSSSTAGGLVRIVISEGEGRAARTVQPAASALAGYRLTFSSGHDPIDLSAGNGAEVYLPNGTYYITATAYKAGGTVGNSGDVAASGNIYVTLSGGVVISDGGVVPPIILYPESGSGTLEYSITSAAAVSGTMKLWEINGTDPISGFGTSGVLSIDASPSLSAQTYSLAVGRYITEIRLVDVNGDIALLQEVVEIWTGTTTAIVFTPDVYFDPSAAPANSGTALSALSVIGGMAIGAPGAETGVYEGDAVSYSLMVVDINDADQSFVLETDSLFADISWIANTGTTPDGVGYSDTPVTDFSTDNILWVKVVSEDGSAVRYYKFTLAALDSDLTVVSGDGLYTYVGNVLRIIGDGTYAISMKTGGDTTTRNRIEVASGITADITLNGVKIDMSGNNNAAAFDMTGATVQLTLNGVNELKSGYYRAGLEAPEDSTLTINAADETHSLIATGSGYGAGIGGAYDYWGDTYGTGGTVTINSGTVIATGGSYGAGIGGSYYGAGGTVTITGGTVTANGSYGVGIGSGYNGNGGTVTISNSTVTANSIGGADGIVTISGSTVSATGDIGGADGAVTVSDSTITASSINGIAELSDNAVVFASSIQPALIVGDNVTAAIAFIGAAGVVYDSVTLQQGLEIPAGSTLSVPVSSVLTIPDGTSLINNGAIILYPGGAINGTITGNQPVGPDLTISGDSSYTYVGGLLTITGDGTYAIAMNGDVSTTSDHVVVSAGVNANITLNGVDMPTFAMGGATVQLTLSGTNTLHGDPYRAGLEVPEGSSLTINAEDETNTLTTWGGSSAAGIGGRSGGKNGNITITGGAINAYGGYFNNSNLLFTDGGAGIGGGYGADGGTITITGGVVSATGGGGWGRLGGADIGGGGGGCAGGTIIITGGVVYAYIGGGSGSTYLYTPNGPPGTIALSGNAVIRASSIAPTLTAGDNATGGIAFNGNAGTMYGDVILQQDLTIPNTHTLDLAGYTLTIPGSVTLTNEGTINKNGGTIVGTVGGGGTVN
jgi:hypothetical protein